jgi:hypothetical protein
MESWMVGKPGWFKWPSPYETASLVFAGGALILSYFGYQVSRGAEDAQKENLLVRCNLIDQKLEFIGEGDTKIPAAVRFAWKVNIYNNGRGPASYDNVSINIANPDTHGWGNVIQSSAAYSPEKFGAEHSLVDRNVFLEAGKGTTVGFDRAIRLNPDGVPVSMVTSTKELAALNAVLSHSKVIADTLSKFTNDGIKEDRRKSVDGTEPNPVITVTVQTGRENRFTDYCHL